MKSLACLTLLTLLSGCTVVPVEYNNPAVDRAGATPGSIAVLAKATEWRHSGITVQRGQRYEIQATGLWYAAPTCTATGATGAGMYGLLCPAWPLGRVIQGQPHQMLIAKIGENGTPFPIGASHEFVAGQDGTLYLSINETFGNAWDNSGSISVVVYETGGQLLTGQMDSLQSGPEAALSKFPQWDRSQINPNSGIYMLEGAKTFNILDKVVFDPSNGLVTLIGHTDDRYSELNIPYLQHLATLLESPSPAFSLNWTPQSQASIDDLFIKLDSDIETQRMAASWGEWIDANGQVTPMGRFFMPIFGVTPTNDRFEIIASMLRATGNHQGAQVVVQIGEMTRLLNQPVDQSVINQAFMDLLYIAVPYDTLQNIDSKTLTDDQRGFQRMQALGSSFDTIYKLPNRPVRSAFDQAINQGYDFETATTRALAEMDQQLRTILSDAMTELLHRHDRVRVPPEVIQHSVGIRPEVIPEYIGLDPRSQLARVMFEADYVGKQIPNREDLEDKIPGFLTDFSFGQKNARGVDSFQSTSTHRLWISVDNTDFAQSRDGSTFETRGVSMRFNIREMRDGKDLYTQPGSYEALLTSYYDELAYEFPVLHELRETAKLKAAARWIHQKRPGFRLPVAGRTMWQGPEKVPGLVYFVWVTRPIPGRTVASMIAMGGVSLDFPFDTAVVDLRPDRLTVPPVGELKIIGDVLEMPADTPIPDPIGWIRTDTSGGNTITALSVRAGSLPDTPLAVHMSQDPSANALLLWKANDLDSAYNELLRREEQWRNNPAALAKSMAMRAEMLHEKGLDAAAIALLNEARQIDPNNPIFGIMLIKAKAESGDRQGAIMDLERIVQQQPGNTALASVLNDLKNSQSRPLENQGTPTGRLSTFPQGTATNHSLFDYGLGGDERGDTILLGGFEGASALPKVSISPMEKIEPVPIEQHPNFTAASNDVEYQEMQKDLTTVVEKQADLNILLEKAKASVVDSVESDAERQAQVEQVEKLQLEVDQQIVATKEKMVSFVVNFGEEEPTAEEPPEVPNEAEQTGPDT